ncbi:helix-turn-helix domain-containing protein [Streptomyces sp. NPDC005485]|uniref:helix-turn-helix domain-containing protein n=1 Tax=Streptomyces sp. NPDC005485 TaxID=3155591 RepID=UPI0033AAD473
MLQAPRLLAHADDAAAVVARRLGFSGPTNLSKFFASRTGVTPSDFRCVHQ